MVRLAGPTTHTSSSPSHGSASGQIAMPPPKVGVLFTANSALRYSARSPSTVTASSRWRRPGIVSRVATV